MKFDAVLFDLFDTLILVEKDKDFNTLCLKKLHEFFVKEGINVSFDYFKRVYSETLHRLYSEADKNFSEPHFNLRVLHVLKQLGHNASISDPIVTEGTAVFAREFMRYVHLDDEALGVLQKLHAKYRLGLISNFAIPECAQTLLERFGLNEFFDVILVSGEINKRKPSHEIFERALTTLDVNPSRAVFIGDTPSLDIEGAKNVGMTTILVERIRPNRFGDAKPDRLVRSLRNLLETIVDAKPQKLVRSFRELPERIVPIKPDWRIRSLKELLTILEDC
ncbi:MAG TPA: HAD family hydrolase [Candidatus Bathyarchaeia archaeon]